MLMTLLAPGHVAAAADDAAADARPDRGLDPGAPGGSAARGRADLRGAQGRGHGLACRGSGGRRRSRGRVRCRAAQAWCTRTRRARSALPFTLAVAGRRAGGQDEPGGAARRGARLLLRDVARGRGHEGGRHRRQLDVTCEITMDEVEGGHHRIVASDARRARAGGRARRRRLRSARPRPPTSGCPFSALIRASASVTRAGSSWNRAEGSGMAERTPR